MYIDNKIAYKDVSLYSLELSLRTRNTLLRAGIKTLYQLIEKQSCLDDIRGLGKKGIEEIESLFITDPEDKPIDNDNNTLTIRNSFRVENLQRPIDDLKLSSHIKETLNKRGINTIDQILALNWNDINNLHILTPASKRELYTQISALFTKKDDYFDSVTSKLINKPKNRKLDIDTFKNLRDYYGLKTSLVCEWYGISKQALSQKLLRKKNKGCWYGKELFQEESSIINDMINSKSFYIEYNNTKFYLLNNLKDDAAIIIVSEKEIKCFYLKDLPDDIKSSIYKYGFEKYTEEEIRTFPIPGEVITILKKPYFLPDDPKAFQKLAQSRNMSADEYSVFLYSIPYCRQNVSVTDEKIISFLEEHTIDGRTFIPTTPDSLWLRSFMRNNNYSIEELINFYGFHSELDVKNAVFHDNTIESDMQVYTNNSSNDFIENIYLQYPLLGNALISKEKLDDIHRKSHEYVNKLLSNSNESNNLHDDMVLTLAMVSYVREWDSADESGFWRFITTKFGYLDSQSKLRNILCGCLHNALVKNRRWFLTKNRENLYKSSLVIHSFSTRRSWLHFCNFLFDFYKNNLDWTYIENDSMFSRMIEALRNRIQDIDDGMDENIEINSTYYQFREGIVKLILYRPNYATQVVMRMVKRIDDLINHTALTAQCYEEQLCDEWMKSKLQSIVNSRERNSTKRIRIVAVDYTKIKPFYSLYNENQIQIVFPDVRLEENVFDKLELNICKDGNIIKKKNLSSYGNELGKTMLGFTVNLEEFFQLSGSEHIDPQIIIKCDSKEIYNSGKSLFRDALVFKNKQETEISNCSLGGYSFFYPVHTDIKAENAEISPIIETSYIKGYYINLLENFVIFCNDDVVCLDNSRTASKPILNVNSRYSAVYAKNGYIYQIISGYETIQIIAPNSGDENKFALLINGQSVDLSFFPYKEVEGRRIFEINFNKITDDIAIIRLIDFEKDYPIYQGFFKLIPEFSYTFNKPFYFSKTDYENACLILKTGYKEENIRIDPSEKEIAIAFHEGKIIIPIPLVRITDNNNTEWKGNGIQWIKNIPQDLFLYAKTPENVNIKLMINGYEISTEKKNVFALGNALYSFSIDSSPDLLCIVAKISVSNGTEKNYPIGQIAIKEQFVNLPMLFTEGHKLSWDQGHGFIGESNCKFLLTICEGTEYEKNYSITAETEIIDENLLLPIGIYDYKISKSSGNIFSPQIQDIISGKFSVGDKNELRFLNKTIQIDAITCEEKSPYENIKVRKSFIDNITFDSVQYFDCEKRECPVYYGIMYFETADGRRREYSYSYATDKNNIKHEKINPVMIIFLNENTLSITNQGGDGFYIFRHFDKYEYQYVYEITDRELTLAYSDQYYLADLYIFSIKE